MRNTIQKLWTVWGLVVALALAVLNTHLVATFPVTIPAEAYPDVAAALTYGWATVGAIFFKLRGLYGKN